MTEITTVGIDLAKTVFQVHASDAFGRPVVRKKLRRGQLLAFFAALEPCIVGLEACARITTSKPLQSGAVHR